MPHHEDIDVTGEIGDVFAHRFVLQTRDGPLLVDLGPKGAERFVLRRGDLVRVRGEKKPSEIKVAAIAREGEPEVEIGHGHDPKHDKQDHKHDKHEHHPHVDPMIALRAADAAGYDVQGEPVRKPKHFDLRARSKDGREVELHIELDGHIKKEKPIARG